MNIRLKPYEEYKETGLSWLDRVPKHWKIARVKSEFVLVRNPSFEENPTVLSLTQKGVKVRDISKNEGQLAESYDGYNTVEVGDICLNPMDLKSGAAGVSEYEGVISNAYHTIRPRQAARVNTKFYGEYFNMHYKQEIFYPFGKGVGRPEGSGGRWCLNSETFMRFPLLYPPKEEQDQIVGYLENKISQIDKFIKARTRQIELLKEYKQVIINQAIARGLDPCTKMKPSGVEWLGNIPERWEVVQLRRVAKTVKTGGTPEGADEKYYAGNGFSWYTPSDFGDDLYLAKSTRQLSELGRQSVDVFPANTIMMIGIGATGKVAISGQECSCNQQINAIICNELVDVKYLTYYLRAMRQYIFDTAKYTTLPILNQNETKKIPVLLCGINDQREIVAHIETKTQYIDKAITRAEKQFDLITEYRTSLISSVITGRLDVRSVMKC